MSVAKPKSNEKTAAFFDLEAARSEHLDGLTLMYDEYMALFFKDQPELVQLLLRAILGDDELVVVELNVIDRLSNPAGRTAELDVHAVDSRGDQHDIEVQIDKAKADPRRARFYSALIDARMAEPGKRFDFAQMKDSTVIFITPGDVFGLGRPVYDFVRQDLGTRCRMGDGTRILYVDALARHEGRLADLMHDFICRDPDAMMVPEFASRARQIKDSGRYQEMESLFEQASHVGFKHGVEQGYQQGLQKGIQAGIEKGMQEGLQQGIEQGKQEGLQEGIEQGKQEGLQQGIEQGMQEGMQQGIEKGLQEGMQQGIEKGLQEGLQQGIEKGLQEGLQQGIEQGLQEGLQEGLEQGARSQKAETARRLCEMGLPMDQIARAVGLEEEALAALLDEQR